MTFKYYTLSIIACLISVQSSWAQTQTNPYPYGTPHYWLQQGTMDMSAGKFDLAYEHLKKAEKQYRELGALDFQMNALEAMGTLDKEFGEWNRADSLYREALQIATDCRNDVFKTRFMVDLLSLYRTAGDISGYNHHQKALDSLYSATHSAAAKTWYHLYWTNEYVGRKEFAMAENQMQMCWDVMQEMPFAEKEQAKLMYYMMMMNLKKQQNKYKEAIGYAKDYVEQTKNINGVNSDQQYQAYGSLCNLYALDNDSTHAFACLDSLERGVSHSYQDKEWTANFYNTKGDCYAYFKKYEIALEYYEKAYTLLEDRNTADSPSKFASVKNRAEAYFRLKRYDEAYTAYSEFIDVAKNKFGESSGGYHQVMYNLANLESYRENFDKADSLYRASMNYLLGNVKRLWRYSTPKQREQFWMDTLNGFSGIGAFAIKGGNECGELTETCYNGLLFAKALMLETEKSAADIIRNEGTEEDIANYRHLLSINNRLLKLETNYEYNKQEIDSLTFAQRDLEWKLSSTCQSFNEYDSYIDIDYKKVRDCLKDNEVVVDFSLFQDEDSIVQYDAYIFDKDKKYPILRKCFTQQQLDSLLDGMQSFTLYDYEQLQDKAEELIWKPMEASIPEGSTVYYVPSGILHAIALEALPLSDGTTLGQHYRFVRLTSARELLRAKGMKAGRKTAVLYGGLKYDVSAAKMAEESQGYDKSDLSWVMRSAYGSKGFKELGNTKGEVEKIEQTLTGMGYTVTPYMDTKGNAESFIAMSGKAPSILHIATHGFYYTPDEAKDYKYFEGNTDAMSLSGLVFAGGNTAWLGKEKTDGVLGGILTANDIANLDFRGTDMVVLSACKTAQGKVTAEGVWGLQRAFKKAGVGTIVMSLWNVDDKVTSEFMTTFYERLADTANAGDRRKAFEQAREIIRQKHPDPFHWAAFVILD